MPTPDGWYRSLLTHWPTYTTGSDMGDMGVQKGIRLGVNPSSGLILCTGRDASQRQHAAARANQDQYRRAHTQGSSDTRSRGFNR